MKKGLTWKSALTWVHCNNKTGKRFCLYLKLQKYTAFADIFDVSSCFYNKLVFAVIQNKVTSFPSTKIILDQYCFYWVFLGRYWYGYKIFYQGCVFTFTNVAEKFARNITPFYTRYFECLFPMFNQYLYYIGNISDECNIGSLILVCYSCIE